MKKLGFRWRSISRGHRFELWIEDITCRRVGGGRRRGRPRCRAGTWSGTGSHPGSVGTCRRKIGRRRPRLWGLDWPGGRVLWGCSGLSPHPPLCLPLLHDPAKLLHLAPGQLLLLFRGGRVVLVAPRKHSGRGFEARAEEVLTWFGASVGIGANAWKRKNSQR